MSKHSRTASAIIKTPGHPVAMTVHTSGPLPPADELAKYNALHPGFADRIIIMAEKQADHRRSIEQRVIRNDTFRSNLGMILGFIIGLSGLAIGAFVAISNQPWAGSAIGGSTILGLVGAFVYGSQSRQQDLSRKRPQEKSP